MASVSYRGGQATTRCSSGAVAAWTTIGGSVIFLCPHFSDLTSSIAGRTSIHELLHTAGPKGNPPYPTAMASEQINDLGHRKCGL